MHELISLVLEQLRGAWRFRWRAVIFAWVLCIIGWAVVLVIPNKYEATSRVFVDPTSALKPVIQGLAVEQDVDAELNLVRQSLLSDPNLLKIVGETSLGAKALTAADRANEVKNLRDRIQLEVQSTAAMRMDQPPPSKLYVLRYQDSDRARALQVVQLLTSTLVEGTLGGKREGSQKAQQFLGKQIRDYETRLAEAEQRLADFKKRNVGMVPGEQQGDFFSRLQAEMDAVKQAQTALAAATNRRDALQRQLRGEGLAASAGVPSGVAGGGTPGGDTLSRIQETQARVDELRLRFTDKHPDVVAARENLAQLQLRREQELAALRRGDANAAAITGASANPVYQSIQLSLNQAEIEIATIRSQLSAHQSKVGELRLYLDTMPQVEAEYARLTRDYTVTKAQYTSMAERLEKAKVGEEAEASGSVRFENIDPPSAGFSPVSPPRTLLLAAVLPASLVLGAAVAYLFNLLNPVFSTIRALSDATGLPVLGSVGRADAGRTSRRRLQFMQLGGAIGGLVIVLIAVVFVSQRYAPLGGLS